MVLGFGLEGPGSIPHATTKDPPITWGVCAHKTYSFESPMVSRQQFTMGVLSEKNFPPFQRHIKIEEVDDGWCCHLLQTGRNWTPAIGKKSILTQE